MIPTENKMPSGVDSFVEEATKEEVKTPEKPAPNQPKPDWKQTKMASGVLHEQGKNRIVEESTPDFKSKQYRVGGTQGKVYNSLDEAKNSFNQEQPKLTPGEEGAKPSYKPFKLDRAKYSDVETTPYGFIYNVGGQSITDMAGQAHAFGEHDPKKKYGWTRTTDSGDEIVHESFEDAYKAINKEKLDKEYENDMARRYKRIKSYSKEDGIDDMKTAASYLVNAPHEFEELSSELVNRIENVKDKGKLEDIIFENLQIGDSYEEAVENALENFKNEEKQFDLNYFKEAGEKDLGLSQVQTAIGRQLTMEEYDAFIYPKLLKMYDEYKTDGYDDEVIRDEIYDVAGSYDLVDKVMKEKTNTDEGIEKEIDFFLNKEWENDPELDEEDVMGFETYSLKDWIEYLYDSYVVEKGINEKQFDKIIDDILTKKGFDPKKLTGFESPDELKTMRM